MDSNSTFQGVVCCCLDTDRTVLDTINKLLDLKTPSTHQDIACYDLKLKNKYYEATTHLFDFDNLATDKKNILENCHAIILYGNGRTLTTGMLNSKLEQLDCVGGEPRVLLYDGIDEKSEPYQTLQDWCIKNGYDFLDAEEETAQSQLIDSLSAYKWTHRTGKEKNILEDTPKLNDETVKQLMNFDNLLGKLSAYRDRPELRGHPDDKNIIEIAEILSDLLGDDVDDFLDNEEDNQDHD